MSDWEKRAAALAAETVHPSSRWSMPLATTPRHTFVPRWWEYHSDTTILRIGEDDAEGWMSAAYDNRTLVTRIGPLHADHAAPGQQTDGRPTSSSTMPCLVVQMYQHAMITDGCDVLCTTGSGYGTALLCRRLGAEHVTSIDVDPYLVHAATQRMHPTTTVCDITGALPGQFDRIVSTVSIRPIPISWVAALKPGGRLVTTIAGTGLIVVADKTPDGGAFGRIAPEGAGFMSTRHSDDYDDHLNEVWEKINHADAVGEDISTSRYPLLFPPDDWSVYSMLELTVPGIEHRRAADADTRTVWLLHEDGSWARATADAFLASPEVHQGGPRRLWDELERVRHRLNREGTLPVYGAPVRDRPRRHDHHRSR
ncbi:protein-L-isoaspartate(D-aspartate) O-methyltransferase [Streptomyces silvisoli]|uniref:protein-L-isoaspartate(D-aspartate) O-methyltransferase n=1 Tax=Streptomyces silvisoli TaxID=3034235 RepID=UPI0028BF0053|nr:protein-L-isoaspartate(D-aspartate) O-methyltransferase [Streptomyces silvisoli]